MHSNPALPEMRLRLVGAALLALAARASSGSVGGAQGPLRSISIMPASDARVRWSGRTAAAAGAGVSFDWEGVSATLALQAPWTFLTVNISDACAGSPALGGGSRWLVSASPASPLALAPLRRVSTFWTGPRVSEYYLLSNPGGGCDPDCSYGGLTTVTLTRLTESRLSLCSAAAGLTVVSFATDGAFAPPPPAPPRRLEFVGDSITAGDLNDGAGDGGASPAQCSNSAGNDDITLSSGGRLCLPASAGGLGADCTFTAWGGIKLGVGAEWGMSDLYPFTFSAGGRDAYAPWAFPAPAPDAVVVNLGTNDRPPPGDAGWVDAYVGFATDVVRKYHRGANVTLFLAYGPMTDSYEGNVRNVTAQLAAAGLRAFALDLTLPHAMTGCYGHPSAADNVEIAAKAKPQIQAALGWAD